MKSRHRLAGCALAFSLLGLPAAAQSPPGSEPPPTLSLAAALDGAWQRALASRETAGGQRRAQAERQAAASLWAAPPAVELTHRSDRLGSQLGQRETELSLAWPIWLPGQRARRLASAEASAAAAQQAEAAARLKLAGDLREAAWALVARQAELAQAEVERSALAALADDVDRRVRAGDLARSDALAARAEVLGATARAADARQQLQAERSRWQLLTGSGALPAAAETTSATDDALASHPALRLAQAHSEAARQRLQLLRHTRRDPPEVIVGVRQDRAARGDAAQHSVAVGVRWPFGTADRNLPLEAAALADLDLAEFDEARTRDRLAAEAAAARSAVQAAEQQLGAARERAGLLRERSQLLDKSFRAGESPLPDVLRALAAAAEADAAAARQQAALGLARARLHQAQGSMP